MDPRPPRITSEAESVDGVPDDAVNVAGLELVRGEEEGDAAPVPEDADEHLADPADRLDADAIERTPVPERPAQGLSQAFEVTLDVPSRGILLPPRPRDPAETTDGRCGVTPAEGRAWTGAIRSQGDASQPRS